MDILILLGAIALLAFLFWFDQRMGVGDPELRDCYGWASVVAPLVIGTTFLAIGLLVEAWPLILLSGFYFVWAIKRALKAANFL